MNLAEKQWREETPEGIERTLQEELGVALSRDQFVTCSHWDGDGTARKVWAELIKTRLELTRVRKEEVKARIALNDPAQPFANYTSMLRSCIETARASMTHKQLHVPEHCCCAVTEQLLDLIEKGLEGAPEPRVGAER